MTVADLEYFNLIKDAVKKGMKAHEVKGNVVPACVYHRMLREYPKEFKEIAKMLAYNASMRLKKKAVEKNGDDYEQIEAVKQLILSGMKLNDIYNTTKYDDNRVSRLRKLYPAFAKFIANHKYPVRDREEVMNYYREKLAEGYVICEIFKLGKNRYSVYKSLSENQKDELRKLSRENGMKKIRKKSKNKIEFDIKHEPDIICSYCHKPYTYKEFYGKTKQVSALFRLLKTCSRQECINKSRAIGIRAGLERRKNNIGMYDDLDKPLTWVDYFDMELRHKYDDTFNDMPMSNLLQRFSKDSEIPLKILLHIRDGRDMITADMANILRKNGVYYSVETIISLQHKLCEKLVSQTVTTKGGL